MVRIEKTMVELALLFTLIVTLNSCNDRETVSHINDQTSINIPFDIDRSIFLNQFTSPSSGVTSWLMVDSNFIRHQRTISQFLDSNNSSNNGTLCILHWSRIDDPAWIGARIPGKFLSADLIMYKNDSLVIKQYDAGGEITTPNDPYKNDLIHLVRTMGALSYP